MVSQRSLAAGHTRASHSFGFSPMARRRPRGPVCVGGMTPARMASSMRRLKRRRRINDRRIIADDTNNNKNSVARNVNLSLLFYFRFPERERRRRRVVRIKGWLGKKNN